ncbi:hypothetical protein [Magnetospira sp. QH-2]|uniref:hypothetical protein n=1 Tax=Magnetospira sp. (strain QH-2) TaxID=1288970 RepID=UPI00130E53BA|nr:hypothetical protein [Magnetospira sp. QH-2]
MDHFIYIIHQGKTPEDWCVSVNGVLVNCFESKDAARRMVDSLRRRNGPSAHQ